MNTPDYFSTQSIRFDEFNYEPLRNAKIDCGELTYKLVRLGSPEPLPSWIRLDRNTITVNALETQSPVQIEANLVVGLKDYREVQQSFPFKVTVIDPKYTCN